MTQSASALCFSSLEPLERISIAVLLRYAQRGRRIHEEDLNDTSGGEGETTTELAPLFATSTDSCWAALDAVLYPQGRNATTSATAFTASSSARTTTPPTTTVSIPFTDVKQLLESIDSTSLSDGKPNLLISIAGMNPSSMLSSTGLKSELSMNAPSFNSVSQLAEFLASTAEEDREGTIINQAAAQTSIVCVRLKSVGVGAAAEAEEEVTVAWVAPMARSSIQSCQSTTAAGISSSSHSSVGSPSLAVLAYAAFDGIRMVLFSTPPPPPRQERNSSGLADEQPMSALDLMDQSDEFRDSPLRLSRLIKKRQFTSSGGKVIIVTLTANSGIVAADPKKEATAVSASAASDDEKKQDGAKRLQTEQELEISRRREEKKAKERFQLLRTLQGLAEQRRRHIDETHRQRKLIKSITELKEQLAPTTQQLSNLERDLSLN